MTNSNEPLPPAPNNTGGAPPNRMPALLVVVVAGGLLALNHYEAVSDGKVYLWLIFMAPLFLFLGIGGLIDPRILWSIGPKGQHFPMRIKVIGGLLAVAGLLVSAYLALGVYRLQEPSTSKPSESRDVPDSSR